ncbi:hypothetical protein QTO34_000757 [Cnephaeus nilssonii]|uniref:Uncharacterized protein n=1 Tax=Cnephaeus nilssonii TaxID=3371016 RepID=A0AA40IBZ8_CNENI|nr:hypothetical protein QTO34_000757 [Eptesicus nilssonii]
MDEIGNHYMEMVKNLRMEKDREICKLRTQLNQYQKDVSRREGSCSDFQFKIHELTSLLEEKDSLIKRQSEEQGEVEMPSGEIGAGSRQAIETSARHWQYRTQYPILGLLYDDYEYIPPERQAQTRRPAILKGKVDVIRSLQSPRIYNYSTQRTAAKPKTLVPKWRNHTDSEELCTPSRKGCSQQQKPQVRLLHLLGETEKPGLSA